MVQCGLLKLLHTKRSEMFQFSILGPLFTKTLSNFLQQTQGRLYAAFKWPLLSYFRFFLWIIRLQPWKRLKAGDRVLILAWGHSKTTWTKRMGSVGSQQQWDTWQLVYNVCFIKIRSKLSSVLLLCLLRFFMKQTLIKRKQDTTWCS